MSTQHLAVKASCESLSSLLASAGIDRAAKVDIDGADPVLPTQFRIAGAGSVAIAAAACSAAAFWRTRGGVAQRVAVDARRAAVAMRSASYLRIDGARPPSPWDRLSGFYPVREGRYISIHCNFPVHANAALRVLGTAPDRADLEAATKLWDGVALEDAIHAAGGCAGFVRTAGEWRQHPQASAVASQPLIEIERIGDAPPAPMAYASRPLAGIRVLDLTRVLAGPTCARVLAEQGADVLKVNAPHLAHSGWVELDTGMGKLATHLDLRTEEDLAKLQTLVEGCNVFSQSYRPGTLATRGFAPADLAVRRPGIVCASLSGWGPNGPWARRRGFDSIVQCVSGMAHDSGDGVTPQLLPVSAIDYVSGYLLAFGVTVALSRRATQGGSWHVHVALARVGKWIVDQGKVDSAPLTSIPAELPEAELAGFMAEMTSPAGRLQFLAPVAVMSETPPYFQRPGVMPGAHAPEWPA